MNKPIPISKARKRRAQAAGLIIGKLYTRTHSSADDAAIALRRRMVAKLINDGFSAVEIAAFAGLHVNTINADWRSWRKEHEAIGRWG